MKKDTGQNRDITSQWRLQTQLVRGGTWRSEMGETSEAMFMTSGYAYDCAEDAAARFAGDQEGYTYSRLRNPTAAMFEDKMALIEGAEVARSTATGMAAVTAAMLSIVKAGDHVISSRALFGSCRYVIETLMPKFGVDFTLVDGSDHSAWKEAFRPNTVAVFLETPANPTLDVVDVQFVCDLAHENGAVVVVDNVFATPVLQKPIEMGADVVIYSATKHIDGQGRCLGGCILTTDALMDETILPFLRNTGPNISPFNAWVMLKGLETLDLRVERMCGNAAKVADALSDMGGLDFVKYPGRSDFAQHELAMKQMSMGGSIIALHVPGGREQAFKFLNALDIIDISNNIGDAKSLMTHPASTTHASVAKESRLELGIDEGLLRLSVGLEHADDLIEDLIQAAAIARITK
ncbi:O-succinylhomoserine sulfhydrylase [Paremcibacter congregatus]|uniref:O-succinylhomoserine sulfhydrylase n=1 Tax=Paremcibacter congregatus TaxID=2043170 RepID=A0A2G4YUC5_9PROT|nr:O-succinylhomoserine sulfhydrylase [Paremcibacter congregatus]PHZ85948.1 O-succinylhomoserine sulfhydrylase [Paremcibacter congregatus]QDE26913.1 O-succinylhomoserine sulfhydrylase [Paremcibacter congregatus]